MAAQILRRAGQRPASHAPTEATRALVKVMVVAGMTQRSMAEVLKISLGTLQRAYKRELKTGADEVLASLAGKQFQAAMAGNTQAGQFLLRTRFGWGAEGGGGRGKATDDDSDKPYQRTAEAEEAFQAIEDAIRARSGGHLGSPPVGDGASETESAIPEG